MERGGQVLGACSSSPCPGTTRKKSPSHAYLPSRRVPSRGGFGGSGARRGCAGADCARPSAQTQRPLPTRAGAPPPPRAEAWFSSRRALGRLAAARHAPRPGMACWVFCNRCFQPPRRTSSFSLTSCGHVYCDVCLGKGQARSGLAGGGRGLAVLEWPPQPGAPGASAGREGASHRARGAERPGAQAGRGGRRRRPRRGSGVLQPAETGLQGARPCTSGQGRPLGLSSDLVGVFFFLLSFLLKYS